AGLPLRDARAGLTAIAAELEEREDGLVDLAKRPAPAPLPPPRLLGAFDPLLLGWTSREEVVGPHKMLVTINGIFKPFALVDGRAVATWRIPAGKVAIEPLGKIAKKAMSALEADAREVERFLAAQ
ncbi:MAG TPA: crosslink repair DNA glycosylase YcaQ family protein, partial [Solirubrobacterales bacterium]|nr:crosslink repair DNA glycosylase YcaQ family protein [Solirubrobacterales bacterium]